MSHPHRLRIGIIFGGRSVEHEVSLVSATSIINALDVTKYDVIQIGITHEGKWVTGPDLLRLFKERRSLTHLPEFILTPDPTKRGLVGKNETISLDVLFPVLHGTYGEDGTLQGLCELADIPYVGAGVLGSAVGMDKIVQKNLLQQARLPVAKSVWFFISDFNTTPTKFISQVERQLGFPVFVKPARSGSSVGISKSHNRKELREHIAIAAQYDEKILIEKAVPFAREIECAVLGNEKPRASVPGEIIPSNEFYDYDAKYVDGKSTTVIPAVLPSLIRKKIQRMALDAFRTLDCSGMARVDFLLNRKTNAVVINEINTIPGFTSISMYPKLWEASGIPYAELLDTLIALAVERHRRKVRLQTTYKPTEAWYTKEEA